MKIRRRTTLLTHAEDFFVDGRMNEPTTKTGVSGMNKVLTGAVGITKAALHVDRADEVVIRKRRSLCAACRNANAGSSKTSRCLICSCFIWPKTATASEKCPIGNW